MKKVKYPVKYALLPIKERRTNKDGEEYFINICHIVSKVFVTKEFRVYLEDGNYDVNYSVCFPYEVNSDGIIEEMRIPSFNSSDYNETIAFDLYDNYEEAQKAKEDKNFLFSIETVEKYDDIEERLQILTKNLGEEKEKKEPIKHININNKDLKKSITEIRKFLLEKRGVELSYYETIIFLGITMNLDDFGIDFLLDEYENGPNISYEGLLNKFLAKTSMDEVLTLYDILNGIGDKAKDNIYDNLENVSKIKKKRREM